jgi:hypothetical protein
VTRGLLYQCEVGDVLLGLDPEVIDLGRHEVEQGPLAVRPVRDHLGRVHGGSREDSDHLCVRVLHRLGRVAHDPGFHAIGLLLSAADHSKELQDMFVMFSVLVLVISA